MSLTLEDLQRFAKPMNLIHSDSGQLFMYIELGVHFHHPWSLTKYDQRGLYL